MQSILPAAERYFPKEYYIPSLFADRHLMVTVSRQSFHREYREAAEKTKRILAQRYKDPISKGKIMFLF